MSKAVNYWVQIFTVATWQRFVASGAGTTGFRDLRWKHIQKLQVGDQLLCYLSGVSKWIGILEVESEPYLDTKKIWDEGLFPCRVDVKVLAKLTLEDGIPIKTLKSQLSIFHTKHWGLYLISSPSKWGFDDGYVVAKAIERGCGSSPHVKIG